MAAIWSAIEQATMPETARIQLFERAAAAMVNHMADLLRISAGTTAPATVIAELGSGVQDLSHSSDRLLSDDGRAGSTRMAREFIAAGAPEQLAAEVAHLFDLDGTIGLARLAQDSGIGAQDLTRAFVLLGSTLGLDWAQHTAERMSPSDPWERLLVNGLARDFQHMRLDFLRRSAAQGDPVQAAARWAEAQAPAINQFRTMLGRAQSAVPVAPAMLAQIASQARNLLGR